MGGTGARPLDRAGDVPLWSQLETDLRRRLAAGEFAGSFAGELALGQEYGVSRHTVRAALRRLREEGLVVAERGRAPRSADHAELIDQPLGAMYSLFASVESTGREQRSVVRVLDVRADGTVATRLGLDGSAPLVHLERLRLADDEPLALDRVWLPEAVAAPLLDADFTHTALYGELARRCGVVIAGGGERIRAVVPTAAERELLGLGAATAAFAIERLGEGPDGPVEYRHTLVRGDRFTLSASYPGPAGYRGAPAGDP